MKESEKRNGAKPCGFGQFDCICYRFRSRLMLWQEYGMNVKSLPLEGKALW
ncbi:MAG: hypothetical protein ACOX3X_05460 [Eubacteriales bacterium]|jgi:hypothetical protein